MHDEMYSKQHCTVRCTEEGVEDFNIVLKKSNHCVEMIQWLCGNFRGAGGDNYGQHKCKRNAQTKNVVLVLIALLQLL